MPEDNLTILLTPFLYEVVSLSHINDHYNASCVVAVEKIPHSRTIPHTFVLCGEEEARVVRDRLKLQVMSNTVKQAIYHWIDGG